MPTIAIPFTESELRVIRQCCREKYYQEPATPIADTCDSVMDKINAKIGTCKQL